MRLVVHHFRERLSNFDVLDRLLDLLLKRVVSLFLGSGFKAERHLWGGFAESLGHWLRGSSSFVQSVVSHGVLDVWLSGHAVGHGEKGLHFYF